MTGQDMIPLSEFARALNIQFAVDLYLDGKLSHGNMSRLVGFSQTRITWNSWGFYGGISA